MGITKKYEADTAKAYATEKHGHVVSRSLFAVVERGDRPPDGGGCGEAEIIEIAPPPAHGAASQDESTRIRIDTVPQDTIAASPDAAAAAAIAMQSLSHGDRGQLNFKVEYPAD
jgi:hypothetical protein